MEASKLTEHITRRGRLERIGTGLVCVVQGLDRRHTETLEAFDATTAERC